MDQFHKDITKFENKLKSVLDLPNHSIAVGLKQEVQTLIQEVRAKRDKMALENRVRQIIRRLEDIADDTVMDFGHRNELIQHAEAIRVATRSL